MLVHAVDQPNVPPFEMPARFSHDVAYFMTPGGERGAPKLPSGEYWVAREDAVRWLEEGVLEVVSPLDSENKAELELTEEQEAWLDWLIKNQIQHVRLAR